MPRTSPSYSNKSNEDKNVLRLNIQLSEVRKNLDVIELINKSDSIKSKQKKSKSKEKQKLEQE